MFSFFLFSCAKKITTCDSITIRYNGYIYSDVKVENKIYGNFVFDTGAPGMVLDSQFCKKNGLDYKTTDFKIGGVGNSKRTVQLITDTINYELNNKEYRFSTPTVMLDLKNMFNKNIDGILGISTFGQKPYMIDYVSQKIIFTDSIKGYESISAGVDNGTIYLDLSITLKNRKKMQGKFLLDTGSNQTILSNHLFMTDGIYNSKHKNKFLSKGGIGGDSNGYFLPVSAVNLGKFKLENLILSVSSDTLGALANPDYMGIIGNDLLDDFNIIFNYQKGKIWIKPNKNFNKNKRKLFRGISFQDMGEKWIIAGIVEDTEAFRKGIRMNDQVLEVNNIPVEKIDIDKFTEKLKVNEELHLKIKRENEVKKIKFKLNVFIRS